MTNSNSKNLLTQSSIQYFKLNFNTLISSFTEKQFNTLTIPQFQVENFTLRNIFFVISSNFDDWIEEIKFESSKFQKSKVVDPFDVSKKFIHKCFPNLILERHSVKLLNSFIDQNKFQVLFQRLDVYSEDSKNSELLLFDFFD
jgi:hypothetical protein